MITKLLNKKKKKADSKKNDIDLLIFGDFNQMEEIQTVVLDQL